MKKDTTFIILGATGDLTKRKIIPAIYNLLKDKKIKKFVIIGVARSDIDIQKILLESKKLIKNLDKKTWEKIVNSSYYRPLDFYNKNDYKKFEEFVIEIEKKHNLNGRRIFYLATLPQHFKNITFNLSKLQISKENENKDISVVYEKPFGDDLKSAREINKNINKIFKEKQIYRIDHYLGKKLVGNIALIRFTNRIFEPLWNKENISSVEIILSENFGIKERGNFYDKYGALKDVVQNHAFQLLSLIAMESPKMISGEYLRNEKKKVLEKVKIKDVILGQYEGYKKEKGVEKNSVTETFAGLHLQINNPRWKGVPFYIKAGKNLDKNNVSIHIKFKKTNCLLSKNCSMDENEFIIKIQPERKFELKINSKVQESNFEVSPINMEFCYTCLYGPNTPEAYEVLLEEIIKRDQSFFVRNDEIEEAWKIIDQIEKQNNKINIYKKGSEGPKELKNWNIN